MTACTGNTELLVAVYFWHLAQSHFLFAWVYDATAASDYFSEFPSHEVDLIAILGLVHIINDSIAKIQNHRIVYFLFETSVSFFEAADLVL